MQRKAESPTDTQAFGGFGSPARPVGLIYSMFRPSDDATLYPFYIPSNLFVVVSLHQLAELSGAILNDAQFANECRALASEVEAALATYGHVKDRDDAEIWAFAEERGRNKNGTSHPFAGAAFAAN